MNEILCGDALAMLRSLPDGIVQTCVTSPPYFGLRDYGVPGQIGLEESPDEYIQKLVEVFREVRRVLRKDGTLWLNCGDSYAGSGKGGQSEEKRSENWQPTYINKGLTPRGYKPKDLLMIPAQLALALRADGWYLRSDIIWHKPNCMPESVEDRPTTAHEHIFLLAKSERYYYDADAIRETAVDDEATFYAKLIKKDHKQVREFGTNSYARTKVGLKNATFNPAGRNKRSVWTVPTYSFPESHFATFPPKLIEPCILAGTSPRACEHCGAPWERVTERIQFGKVESNTKYSNKEQAGPLAHSRQAYRAMGLEGPPPPKTIGWQPTCTCANTGSGKCVVLDPFMGAGTVALVSIAHGRQYLGIELNPDYVKLIEKRIAYVQQNLWSLESEIAV